MAKVKKPRKKIAPTKSAKSARRAPPVKSKAKPAPVQAKKKESSGLPEQLRDAALKVLDDRQAENIVTVTVKGRSSVADYILIASARAARQSAALAHYLREAFAELGVHPVRVEGLPEGNWVLVDAGDVIVHLFRPEVRSYYQLEEIWNAAKPARRG